MLSTELFSGLVGALIGGVCAIVAAVGSQEYIFRRTAKNSLRIIRFEIEALKTLLNDRLNHPHKFTDPPRELYELGFYGDPSRLAPMYMALAGQTAEHKNFISEEIVRFYSKLLNLREGATSQAGHIMYARKSDITDLIELAEKALSHLRNT